VWLCRVCNCMEVRILYRLDWFATSSGWCSLCKTAHLCMLVHLGSSRGCVVGSSRVCVLLLSQKTIRQIPRGFRCCSKSIIGAIAQKETGVMAVEFAY
jgi:hypothetical protein